MFEVLNKGKLSMVMLDALHGYAVIRLSEGQG